GLGQLGSQSLEALPVRDGLLVVVGDATVINALDDIRLQQKTFNVLIAARRVTRPSQGLVPANALHMGAQVSPFRVAAAEQLACRGIRFKQYQIPLTGIYIVRNVSAEFPL